MGVLNQAESWLPVRTYQSELGPGTPTERTGWFVDYLPRSVRAWLTASGPDASGSGLRDQLVIDCVLVRALLAYDLPALAESVREGTAD